MISTCIFANHMISIHTGCTKNSGKDIGGFLYMRMVCNARHHAPCLDKSHVLAQVTMDSRTRLLLSRR